MKTNYVLIDYENVQPDMAELLAPDHFKVIVFVGANQARVNFDLVAALQAKGAGSRYIKISGNGRNALDFHIAYYVGHLAAADPEAYFHVIAEDRGMDPLIQHLQAQGLKVGRSVTLQDIPIVRMDSTAPRDDKLSTVLAYLVSRGHQRPASMKTLIGSISALFNPKLDEAAAKDLVTELETHGVFSLRGAKIVYSLPD
jgi:hypothetical protein